MEEVLELVLSSPAVRAFVADVAISVVAGLLRKRATDPAFLAESDKAFDALSTAKTPEELTNAQNLIRTLMSSGS